MSNRCACWALWRSRRRCSSSSAAASTTPATTKMHGRRRDDRRGRHDGCGRDDGRRRDHRSCRPLARLGPRRFGEAVCLSTVSRAGCARRPISSSVSSPRAREDGRQVGDLPDERHLRRGVRLHVRPDEDYCCYKIPTVAQTACPAGMTPRARPCDVRTARCATARRALSAVSTSTRGALRRSAGGPARSRTRQGRARGRAPATRRGRARLAGLLRLLLIDADTIRRAG